MRRHRGKWLCATFVVERWSWASIRFVTTALLAAVLVTIAVGTTSTAEAQTDPRAAIATTVDTTRESGPVGSIVLEDDFTRLIFVDPKFPVTNLGKTNKVYQGKLVQAREFVSATVLYQPPLPAIMDARFVGGTLLATKT